MNLLSYLIKLGTEESHVLPDVNFHMSMVEIGMVDSVQSDSHLFSLSVSLSAQQVH